MVRSNVASEGEFVSALRVTRASVMVAALAMLVLPSAAFAGSVTSTPSTPPSTQTAVTFTGGTESNDVTFERDAAVDPSKPLKVTDTSPITDNDGAGGCDVTGNVARCPDSGNSGISATLAPFDRSTFPNTVSAETNSFTGLSSLPAVVSGGDGADTVTTSDGVDAVTGYGGNDVISAGGGADSVSGDTGFNFFFISSGSDGNDQLSGGAGNDTVSGEAGDDNVNGDGGNDLVFGGVGFVFAATDGNDQVSGGAGDDTVAGGNGDDIANGGTGDDLVDGGNGDDIANGGTGDDVVDGGIGNDAVNGDGGFDELLGGNGADSLTGGAEPDTISGQRGNDTLNSNDGGPDQDDCGGGNDTVNGDLSDVVAGDCETVNGASRGGPVGPGGADGTAGAPGADGTAGAPGSTGTQGPRGPAGARGPASGPQLFAFFNASRLTVRRGLPLTVRYVVNDAARVTIEVRKGRDRVTGATRRARAGRNSLRLQVARRGTYTLVIVATTPRGAATDRIPLTVR